MAFFSNPTHRPATGTGIGIRLVSDEGSLEWMNDVPERPDENARNFRPTHTCGTPGPEPHSPHPASPDAGCFFSVGYGVAHFAQYPNSGQLWAITGNAPFH
jgi:hypothetical protein